MRKLWKLFGQTAKPKGEQPAREPEVEAPTGQSGTVVLFDSTTGDDSGVDIVFVHGLRGNSLLTWSKHDICWPRDLLKEDITEASLECRVVTWGYDSRVAHMLEYVSQESIFGHAETLLGDLSRLRSGKVLLQSDLHSVLYHSTLFYSFLFAFRRNPFRLYGQAIS